MCSIARLSLTTHLKKTNIKVDVAACHIGQFNGQHKEGLKHYKGKVDIGKCHPSAIPKDQYG
jgi:hypothetical protein